MENELREKMLLYHIIHETQPDALPVWLEGLLQSQALEDMICAYVERKIGRKNSRSLVCGGAPRTTAEYYDDFLALKTALAQALPCAQIDLQVFSSVARAEVRLGRIETILKFSLKNAVEEERREAEKKAKEAEKAWKAELAAKEAKEKAELRAYYDSVLASRAPQLLEQFRAGRLSRDRITDFFWADLRDRLSKIVALPVDSPRSGQEIPPEGPISPELFRLLPRLEALRKTIEESAIAIAPATIRHVKFEYGNDRAGLDVRLGLSGWNDRYNVWDYRYSIVLPEDLPAEK